MRVKGEKESCGEGRLSCVKRQTTTSLSSRELERGLWILARPTEGSDAVESEERKRKLKMPGGY